jgi:vacuolar-type H+-ATPase subunit E/Vma4
MGLEKIRHAVLSEARAEATHIIESAKKKNADFLKSQKAAAEQEFERVWKLRKQTIEDEYSRKLIQAQGAASKQVLDKRNVLLKSLFERAAQEILAWDRDRYTKIMRRFIEKVSGSYGGRIRVHPKEKDLFEKVLSQVKEVREDAKITLDRSDWLPKPGGFIFVSTDFEVDRTLDTMLNEIEHDLLPAIAADLFSGK